jgi:single-strand DNA-binding protein
MNSINHVVLIGHLTKDIETKYTSGGLAIGRFSIAVNRSKKTATSGKTRRIFLTLPFSANRPNPCSSIW